MPQAVQKKTDIAPVIDSPPTEDGTAEGKGKGKGTQPFRERNVERMGKLDRLLGAMFRDFSRATDQTFATAALAALASAKPALESLVTAVGQVPEGFAPKKNSTYVPVVWAPGDRIRITLAAQARYLPLADGDASKLVGRVVRNVDTGIMVQFDSLGPQIVAKSHIVGEGDAEPKPVVRKAKVAEETPAA